MQAFNEILSKFDIEREKLKLTSGISEASIGKCFLPCAKEILCGGYLLVNDKYKIDIRSIELYYHEDNGEIIDPIMYHTPLNMKKSTVYVRTGELPYFEFGSLNLHVSGIDITFENPVEQYRASFLIREYRILPLSEGLDNVEIPFDTHSTHLYDDIFYLGFPTGAPLNLKWYIDEHYKDAQIEELPRVNVAEYSLKDGKYVKAEVTNEEAQSLGDKAFRYGGKYYRKCQRKWQFRRK